EAQSIFSRDIRLGDNPGESGWSSVGDKSEGPISLITATYVRRRKGTTIPALKRHCAFAQLYARLRATISIPATLSQQPYIPSLPPKHPLAQVRPIFPCCMRRSVRVRRCASGSWTGA
ncbi:hypothetical protein C8Q76DRAFT_840040, partial [Earliella scabrosa]